MDVSALSAMFEHVLTGMINALSLYNIFIMFVGMTVGIIGGMLPGITTITTLALFIPFTFAMSPDTALIALGAVYCGSTYGGSNAAVLLNTPGQPGNVATSLDGYAMTKNGKAQKALYVSLFASVFGGVFGGVMLLLFFEPLSRIALEFGSEAFFWMSLFGLSTLAALFPGQTFNGLLSGCLGMALSTVGMDLVTGVPRFTFGIFELQAGLDMVVLMIALFSISQMYLMLGDKDEYIASVSSYPRAFAEAFIDTIRLVRLMSISSLIGTFIGILPGAGGSISSIVAYNEAKRWDKNPERFGTGVVEGIAAPEAANNACVGGSLVPLLALGIPGSAAAAVLAGGLMGQGLTPGPQLLEKTPEIAYAFIASLILVNFVMIPVGWGIAKCSTRILDVPKLIIIPSVITLSAIGTYSLRNSLFDVFIMFFMGACAYLFAKARLHPAAMALGLMLGPIVEENMVTTMYRVSASTTVADLFFFSPLSMLFIALTVLVIGLSIYMNHRSRHLYEREELTLRMTPKNLLRYDSIFTIVIGLLGFIFLEESHTFSGVSRYYPEFIYSGVIVLSGILVVLRLFAKMPVRTKESVPLTQNPHFHFVMYVIISLISFSLIEVLGFYSSMAICMLLMLLYGEQRVARRPLTLQKIGKMVLITVVVLGLQAGCFTYFLDVLPPEGLFY